MQWLNIHEGVRPRMLHTSCLLGYSTNNIYVCGKVESLISEGDLVLEDLFLQDIIIQELMSKADGM